jgi:hypothetical protein
MQYIEKMGKLGVKHKFNQRKLINATENGVIM